MPRLKYTQMAMNSLLCCRFGQANRRGFSAQLFLLLTTLSISSLQCTSAVKDFSVPDDSGKSSVEVILKSAADDIEIGRVEAFVFDAAGKLDVFQSCEYASGESVSIGSTSGDRTVCLLVNTPARDYRWSEIGTLKSFRSMLISLENDSVERPIMTGETRIRVGDGTKSGNSASCQVELRPLSAKIRLNSLKCDFSGTAYEGEVLTNLRVYLCNVNADSRYGPPGENACRLVNLGGIREEDMRKFISPGILCQSPGLAVGGKGISPKLEFLCYANPATEEGPGGSYTRLVIEGDIGGRVWYYPVNIAGGAVLKRGCSYSYDIVLKRKGCTDPDTAVSLGDIKIKFSIAEWNEEKDFIAEF